MNKLFEKIKLLFSVKTVGVFILTISLLQQPVTAETLTVSDLSLSRLFDFAYGLIGDYESLNHRSDDIVNINNQTDKLIVLGVNFKQSYSDNDVSIFTDALDEMSSDDVEAAVIGTPLVYPNPFKFSTDNGGILAYTLSKDMEMEIQIYNMLAQRIFKQTFSEGTVGARRGENKLQINEDTLYGNMLSSGVYFYVLVHDGSVLAKGKMVVKP